MSDPSIHSSTDSISHGVTCGIRIRELTVAFDDAPPVLDALSLDVLPGEIVAVLGASGCGKSTLLRAIARLVQPTSGSITFAPGLPSRRPGDLAYVFQDATLLPWRTVATNVALPLELGRAVRSAASADDCLLRVREALDAVGLGRDDERKFPRELSGGMRMRTSIARALVTDPNVMLLDEPFAALDDMLRTRLNELILELWAVRERTILFVTHNIAEAVYLSHRVALLGQGRVAKIIENPLPWPRTAKQRSSVAFAEIYGKVSASLAEVVSE